jgi:hypothetical protein
MPNSRSCRSICRLSLVRANAPDTRTVGRGCALDVAQEPEGDTAAPSFDPGTVQLRWIGELQPRPCCRPDETIERNPVRR